jgi:hypothetical protein
MIKSAHSPRRKPIHTPTRLAPIQMSASTVATARSTADNVGLAMFVTRISDLERRLSFAHPMKYHR